MSEEILDLKELLDRVQDDKELILELFEIFMEDYTKKREQLTGAFTSENFENIRSIAHSLKGASGNISAKALREAFLKLEEVGKANSLEGHEDLLKLIDEQYEALTGRIEEVKAEYSS